MRYFKRRWEESRGDADDAWGPSWWYFEVDHDGYPLRQVEVYDRGPTKRYSLDEPEDADGRLGTVRLDDGEDWTVWRIGADDFERVWADD
ncbi:hypothetical protein [Nocardioides jiangxiensis]|uniref:Uncharacterized protein n=1 Tax=Nocardioides jiangxiensis TaxID=3064524 RepID=A0ABT9B3Y0_9ACTN|nr:hypothetical protein [Nocardioides sp. WY-20]MDO7869555.1 hypothetical protein [Nocardioides sp. WY-20]